MHFHWAAFMIGARNWAESLTLQSPVSPRTMLLSHDMGIETLGNPSTW